MTADIIAFLNARYDEEKQVANAAQRVEPTPWSLDFGPLGTDEVKAHADLWDPCHVLADLDAKRRLLELHPYAGLLSSPESCESCAVTPGPCPTLRLLALPYTSHPDFREGWRTA